ncbi:MAG: hypothetical protein GC136_10365 [Alphaproteobacteria bacterium]|nr:hypothetical protein [Alphaproteobacteria bacterium]
MKLYRNFADKIKLLNKQLPTPDMYAMPGGRAYRKLTGIYSSQAHVCSVGEEHIGTQRILKARPKMHGGIYAGAAGLVNWGYVAAAKPSGVILYDVNYAQSVFWDMMIKAAAKNEKLEDFLKFFRSSKLEFTLRMNAHLLGGVTTHHNNIPIPSFFYSGMFPYRMIDSIKHWLNGNLKWDSERNDYRYSTETGDRSWLTEENYTVIHALAKNNAIGIMTLDVTNEPCFQQLGDCLRNEEFELIDTENAEAPPQIVTNLGIDICYVSNIFSFLNDNTDWSERRLKTKGNEPISEVAKRNIASVMREGGIIINDHTILDHTYKLVCPKWDDVTLLKYINGTTALKPV